MARQRCKPIERASYTTTMLLLDQRFFPSQRLPGPLCGRCHELRGRRVEGRLQYYYDFFPIFGKLLAFRLALWLISPYGKASHHQHGKGRPP